MLIWPFQKASKEQTLFRSKTKKTSGVTLSPFWWFFLYARLLKPSNAVSPLCWATGGFLQPHNGEEIQLLNCFWEVQMQTQPNHQLSSVVKLPADRDHFPSISRTMKGKTPRGLKVQPELHSSWSGVKRVIFSGYICQGCSKNQAAATIKLCCWCQS